MASIAVLAIAAFLRLYLLDLKPMHHDEGTNGYFLTSLLRQGIYKYDPANYHGSTLYYLTIPAVLLFGLSTLALRFLTSMFGIATVWLVLRLRRHLGDLGTLSAAALVSVSPAAVFYSRYYIHETLFVFFTLGIVVAMLRFRETKSMTSFMLAMTSAAMLFATKETAFVSLGTLFLAWIVTLWMREPAKPGGSLATMVGGEARLLQMAWAGVALFLSINVAFYSSFTTNWDGLRGALDSLIVWSKTGTSDFHAKPFATYVRWLAQEEAPLVALAILGSVAALIRRNRFALFAGAWGFGMLAAYSLIPYKTPWLLLNFVIPMAISGGYGVDTLANWKSRKVALGLAGVAAAVCLYQTVVLNFRQYDNDRYPYVYTQTYRDLPVMLGEIDRFAQRAGTKEIGISIASPEYWPLPWYFRDNQRVGYPGEIAARYDPKDIPLVIARDDQSERLRDVLGTDYETVGEYGLRPGVRLVLFARRDLLKD